MGVVPGPKKVNDNCGKTMRTGMMYEGFAVLSLNLILSIFIVK